MTQNQIAYHNAIENARHNKATEAENERHQKKQEQLQHRSNELAEMSNLITKEHYERMDAINREHYANQDAYNAAALAESQRANLANEGIREQQNAINAAANAELARHQRVTEQIEAGLAENTIYKTQAEVSYTTANTGYVQQRVKESQAQTGYATQLSITEAQRGQNVWADTRLKQAQMNYQNQYAKNAYSQRYLNVSNALQTQVHTATELMRLLAGGVGVKLR